MDLKFNDLLKEPIANYDAHYFKAMKKYYRACTNKRLIESEGIDNFQTILRELGGWPLIMTADSWNETDFDWLETLLKAKTLGLPVDFWLKLEVKSQKLQITAGEPNESNYGQKYLIEIVKIFGGSIDDREVMKDINATFAFDKKFNTLFDDYVRFSYFRNVTLRQLENSTTFPWFQYLDRLLSPDFHVTPDLEISYDVEESKSNFVRLLLDLLNETPKRIQSNALIWQIVQWAVPYLNEESILKQTQYDKFTGTTSEIRPRWKECVFSVIRHFTVGSVAIYSEKYLAKGVRPKITKLINFIREEIKSQSVNNLEKFEELAKSLKQVDDSDVFVGFPDQILDASQVDEYYHGLEFNDGGNYLNLARNLSIFTRRKRFSLLKNRHLSWTEFVPSLHTNSLENVIMNPVDLYSIKYFQGTIPEFANFGFLVEKVKRLYKLDNSILEEYEESCNPTKRYYPNAFVLDGTYLAYLKFVDDGDLRRGETLAGLESFTRSQMFFVSYGTSRCVKRRRKFLLTDEANEHFVNVDLRNSKYFTKVFHCSKESRMSVNENDVCVNKYYPF